MEHLWFKRKKYGWGWTPSTWQGRGVIGVYLLLLFLIAKRVGEPTSVWQIVWQFFAPLVVLTAILIWICYKTGESPRWQWGEKKNKEEK